MPNILSGLDWVQSVCKCYHPTTKVTTTGEIVKYLQQGCSGFTIQFIYITVHKNMPLDLAYKSKNISTNMKDMITTPPAKQHDPHNDISRHLLTDFICRHIRLMF